MAKEFSKLPSLFRVLDIRPWLMFLAAVCTILSFCMIVIFPPFAIAEQNRDTNANNGLNTTVRIRHRVVIPQIIYFRVGSPVFGSIDKVTIDLTQTPPFTAGEDTFGGANPLGDSTPVAATNNGDLQVDLRSNVGSVTLSYQVSNSLGLANGAGQFIGYDQIDTQSDNANLSAPVLENAATNTALVSGNLFSGRVINRQAIWTYSYKNTITPVAGTYNGRITYTASAP